LTIVVLLILVVVWAVVLVPGLLRRRLEARSDDSIGHFHRQLRVLERTGPTLVEGAARWRATQPTGPIASGRPGAVVSKRHGLVLVRPDAVSSIVPAETSFTARPTDPYFHPGACRRRRDVLAAMVCVVLGSGLLAFIPMLRPILGVTAFAVLITVTYMAMLVRMRSRAIERIEKLRYLPEPEASSDVAIQRTAAH
jgi:hypothetical protein